MLLDRDDDDCWELKARLDGIARKARLPTRTSARRVGFWFVVNRLAIEELEAWYFGDWVAVRAAYPKAERTVGSQARYRDSDAITGGTC